MKKVLVVFLILAVAGGLFAQTVVWNGYVNSGLGIFIPDGGDVDLVAIARDSEVAGLSAHINFNYTNADANAGFNIRFRSRPYSAPTTPSVTNFGLFQLPYAYAWLKAFDKQLTINGGLVDNGTFSTAGSILGTDVGEGLGLQFIFQPAAVSGLALEAAAYNEPPEDEITTNGIKYVLGASYELKDTFKFVVTGSTPDNGTVITGVNILAVPGLKAILEAKLYQIAKFGDAGKVEIYETLGYTVADIALQLNLAQYLVPSDDNAELGFRAWLYATYNGLLEGKVVPRLDLTYVLGGKYGTFPGFVHYKNVSVNNSKDSVFVAQPSVAFNFDSASWLDIGYVAVVNLPDQGDTTINHAIYTGVKVSF